MTLYQDYCGFGMLPGVNAAVETSPPQSFTWGPWEYNRSFVLPVILDGASRDEGSSPTTLLRSGLLMAVRKSTKEATTWVYGQADGVGTIVGVLLEAVKLTDSSGNDHDRWHGFILVKGLIKTASLIEGIAASTPGSWIGGGHEITVRSALATRFILDDQFWA